VIAAIGVPVAVLAYVLAGRRPNDNQRQLFVLSPALPILFAVFALAAILTSILLSWGAFYVIDMHASTASYSTMLYPRPFSQGLGALVGAALVIGLATGRRNREWAYPIASTAVAGFMLFAAVLLFFRTVPMATLAFNLIAMGAGALTVIVLAN